MCQTTWFLPSKLVGNKSNLTSKADSISTGTSTKTTYLNCWNSMLIHPHSSLRPVFCHQTGLCKNMANNQVEGTHNLIIWMPHSPFQWATSLRLVAWHNKTWSHSESCSSSKMKKIPRSWGISKNCLTASNHSWAILLSLKFITRKTNVNHIGTYPAIRFLACSIFIPRSGLSQRQLKILSYPMT